MIVIGAGLVILAIIISFAFWNTGKESTLQPSIPAKSNNSSKGETQVQSMPEHQPLLLPKVRDSSLRIELVADGLSFPTSMAFVDRHTILALQKDGGKVIMISNTNGTVQKEPLLQIKVENDSEQGLLGIAVANGTGNTKNVFLYYTANDHGQIRNKVYSYFWTGKSLIDRKLILDLPGTPGPNHNGGKMVVGSDGYLYAVIGNLNRKGMLQNFKDGPPPDDTSVIFRINPENGSAAKGNPFLSSFLSTNDNNRTDERLSRYFAYGIRNSFGLAIDPITDNLWDTENGADYYDEINLVRPGFNSGWQQVMGPVSRDNETTHDFVTLQNSSYADPVFSWKNAVAPTAIQFLNSKMLGVKYADNIFVGDFLNGNLYFFEVNATRTGFKMSSAGTNATTGLADRIVDNRDELSAITFGTGFQGGITDIQTGPDGYLYVLTYGGSIYRIVAR